MADTPLLSVVDARSKILAALRTAPSETVPLSESLGRVLAEDVIARRTQPPSDLSAMDGYAVRAADTSDVPATLKVVGDAPAGGAYDGDLKTGEAVRIFTGAPLPRGADAIVIQEDTEREGDKVVVKEAAKAGDHVRVTGLDFRTGDSRVLHGTLLTPADIALAAAMNVSELKVSRRPVIAFFSTGNELVRPGEELGPNQIISANNDGLAALIRDAGGDPLDLGIARDEEADIRKTAERASEADMLVTLGGASVGDHDLVQSALTPDGLDIEFWRIAMRPGKPLMFGTLGELPMLGLPGNPVSALVCATLFLKPAILRIQGANPGPHFAMARLGRDIPGNGPREDYMRAALDHIEGELSVATPFDKQDSSMLSTLSEAGCLVVRPPFADAAKAGETVKILPLRA